MKYCLGVEDVKVIFNSLPKVKVTLMHPRSEAPVLPKRCQVITDTNDPPCIPNVHAIW